MTGPSVMEFDPANAVCGPVVGYFNSKTTRCMWPQKAMSEIVEVSVVKSSFVVSHQNIT
jgi:hypothetical protein